MSKEKLPGIRPESGQNGKGSKPRPVNKKAYDKNFLKIKWKPKKP